MRYFVKLLLATAVVAVTPVLGSSAAKAEYPDRPITIVVPWGAGGGTDATGRIIGKLLQEELGVPVKVVNRTGGSGVVGHLAISTAKPDGYTIGIITGEIAMMHWAGITELDITGYRPLALFNTDPAGLSAKTGAFKNAKDALDQFAAAPGDFISTGSPRGGIWHLALAGMLLEKGIDPIAVKWVPVKSAGDAYRDVAAGGSHFVTSSIVEGKAMMDAGKITALAVMADKRLAAFPDVPTLKEATGLDWTVTGWRGVAGPKGMDEDAAGKLEVALKTVYDSKEFKDFMNGRGFGMEWRAGSDFGAFLVKTDADMGKVMKAVGLAK